MTFGHPLFLLVIATMIVLVGFLVWNLISVRRNQKHGDNVDGMGGKNDPMA